MPGRVHLQDHSGVDFDDPEYGVKEEDKPKLKVILTGSLV